jgi:hypothetical protein
MLELSAVLGVCRCLVGVVQQHCTRTRQVKLGLTHVDDELPLVEVQMPMSLTHAACIPTHAAQSSQ